MNEILKKNIICIIDLCLDRVKNAPDSSVFIECLNIFLKLI